MIEGEGPVLIKHFVNTCTLERYRLSLSRSFDTFDTFTNAEEAKAIPGD